MKKYITASLFIFWTVTVAILIAGLIAVNNSNNTSSGVGNQSANGKNSAGVNQTKNNTGSTLTMSELAKHNSSSSCWLLISGKIYDVTSFIGQHPGGAGEILKNCGTDATVAYNTKDGRGKPHSSTAQALLINYFIGNLNQVLKIGSSKTTTSSAPSINKTTSPVKINSAVPPVSIPVSTPPVVQTTLALTSAELAKHNSSSSCWLLISGKIYDVTNFINQHPGGANEILINCGTDATTAFNTRGGTGAHSASAVAMLNLYYIGDLNQNITTTPTNSTTSPNSPAPNPIIPQGRGDDENDD